MIGQMYQMKIFNNRRSRSLFTNKIKHEKKHLLTGIGGQDGSYLAEYLVELGYEVHGIVRRNSTPENQDLRIANIEDKVSTYYGDLLDPRRIRKIIR